LGRWYERPRLTEDRLLVRRFIHPDGNKIPRDQEKEPSGSSTAVVQENQIINQPPH